MQNEIARIYVELEYWNTHTQKKERIKRERLPKMELHCWQLKLMNLREAKGLLFKQ